MIVRHGGFADVGELLALAKRAHAVSANARLEFDEQGAKLLAAECMTSKGACVFVAIEDDQIVGAIFGLEQEYGYLKASYAVDIATFATSQKAVAALLERFETWAFGERRVAQIVLGITFGGRHGRAMGHLYNRAGYHSVGGVYLKNARSRVEARTV